MGIYNLLQNPIFYNLKSRILSLGRQSVKNYLSSLNNLTDNSRILDVGCGTGRHTKVFSGTFHGIDLNEKYIDYARQHYAGNFLVMDAASLEFPPENFELVFAIGLCHHLPDEKVTAAVKEMKRVTKKGGHVLIIDAVFPLKTNLPGYLLFKLDRGKHTRTLSQLSDLLTQEGFQLITPNIKGSFPYQRAVFSYRKSVLS